MSSGRFLSLPPRFPPMMVHARALTGLGRVTEAAAEARRAFAAVTSSGAAVHPRAVLFPLAEIEFRAGHIDDALAILEQGLTRIREVGQRIEESNFLRLKAEALLAKDPTNHRQAEECMRSAIDITQQLSGKSYELRAATDLARLLRDTGRRDEARALLAQIYGWFTEGFETQDLRDAKALLKELGG